MLSYKLFLIYFCVLFLFWVNQDMQFETDMLFSADSSHETPASTHYGEVYVVLLVFPLLKPQTRVAREIRHCRLYRCSSFRACDVTLGRWFREKKS